MEEYDDGVANSWQMKLFTFMMGAPIMAYGIWCLYRDRAYTIGLSSGLTTYQGVAAKFVAGADICFAVLILASLIPFKSKRLQNGVFSVLFLLFLVLLAVGMFYSPVSG